MKKIDKPYQDIMYLCEGCNKERHANYVEEVFHKCDICGKEICDYCGVIVIQISGFGGTSNHIRVCKGHIDAVRARLVKVIKGEF